MFDIIKNTFYFIKLIVIGLVFSILLFTLIRNVDYYSYCKIAKFKSNIFEKNEHSKDLKNLCDDIFKDFSEHPFLRFSFGLIYNIIKPENSFENLSEERAINIIDDIEAKHFGTLKFNLRIFKFLNFIFYAINLYIILIILPELITKIIIFILNKCLIIIFIFFLIEGYFNFYTKYEINSIKTVNTFSNYIPMKIIGMIMEKITLFINYTRGFFKI
jgi:hypothetical protein